MVSANTQRPQSDPPTPAAQTEYCPACQQDLRKLKESARIATALRELAEQMEGFDLP
jgi:hypothetical protein